MTTVPFPEAAIGPTIFIIIGFLAATTMILSLYVLKLRTEIETGGIPNETDLNTNQLRISKSTRKILDEIIEEPQLQSDLPRLTNVSKATVSNSIKELKEENYIKRKKRGNSYLIEPKIEKLEEECGR